MSNIFYLLNFTVSGIKNIRKEVRLDFYKKTIDKEFDSEKYRIKAIYGENGSGKSALITAVKIYQDITTNENYLSESINQIFLEEIVNKETRCLKIACEYLVTIGSKRLVYYYEIHIGKSDSDLYEIKYEKLMWKKGDYPNNNYKVVFECREGEITAIGLEDAEEKMVMQRTMNLLASHSMISLYPNVLQKLNPASMGDTFRVFVFNIMFCALLPFRFKVYLEEEDQHELYFLRKKWKSNFFDNKSLGADLLLYEENNNIFSSVNDKMVLKENFAKYEEKVKQLTEFIKIFKHELISIDIEKKENGEQYSCELFLNYGTYRINKEFESTGIKKLIRLFDCFTAASEQGIVFIDELDSNLNDVYLCKLIEYFMYYGKGQLCFTTHNLDPMSVLKENKNSIDFLSEDNQLVPWTSRGNATPENCFRNGMIENIPFNVEATDFVGIFGED